jgi:hypothetical protein
MVKATTGLQWWEQPSLRLGLKWMGLRWWELAWTIESSW